ncbi:hypothetical protein LTR35_018104, partial [Friedmanniomyces endolithicus]
PHRGRSGQYVICGKYDLTEALRLWSSTTLISIIPYADIENTYKLLEAAYLLDSVEEYGRLSIQLFLRHVGPFKSDSTERPHDGDGEYLSHQVFEKSIEYLEPSGRVQSTLSLMRWS